MDRCCQMVWGEENRKQHGQKIVPSRFAQGHGPDDTNSVPSSDMLSARWQRVGANVGSLSLLGRKEETRE